MRKLYLLFLNVVFIFALTYAKAAPNNYVKPNNSVGYEFYVAIAPNEAVSYVTEVIELYIASEGQTLVDYYFGGTKIGSFILKPFEVKTIKLDPTQCEIRKSETPLKQTYRFVSKNCPISIYEVSAKSATTDGTIILPVNAYGTEYVHCSYWENGESKYNYFKSGFIIIASEDSTECTINLKSAGGNTYGKTDKGRVPGETWKVTLQKGECYRVCTDAGTRGEFDISGTRLVSNKPIGMVSYHERAEIPRFTLISSRDHLVEMLPPLNTWGMEYYSIEFDRKAGGGDLFRIICKDSLTKYNVEWYDLKTGVKIGGQSGTLKKAGDFVEIVDMPYGRINGAASVKGMSKFIADKPILVCQYAFSAAWDSSSDFDPFYVALTPKENYVKKAVFQMPANKNFDKNYFNLFVKGDTADAVNNAKLISSLKIITTIPPAYDTDYVVKRYPNLLTNRIPGTDIYWCRVTYLSGGAYTIEGETTFGAYINGFASVDGYGWTGAGAFADAFDRIDTISPVITHSGDQCGNWKIRFTELNGVNDVNNEYKTRQVDYGVLQAPSLLNISFNAKIEFPGGAYDMSKPQSDYTFFIKPIDTEKDMFAIVQVEDRAGNISYDTVLYSATILKLSASEILDFGEKVNYSRNPVQTRLVYNKSKLPIYISEIYLKNNPSNTNNKSFKMVKGNLSSKDRPLMLGAGGACEIEISFVPQIENKSEMDTLQIVTNCGFVYSYTLKGKSVVGKILTKSADFGEVITGVQNLSSDKITIQNTGTDTLTVLSYDLQSNDAFKINPVAKGISFPMNIAPSKSVTLNDFIIFSPPTPEEYTALLTFSHNGSHSSRDSVCQLTGKGVIKGTVETEELIDIKLSPNPVNSGFINVSLPNNEDVVFSNLSIIDETGKILKSINSDVLQNNKKIDVSDLNSGSYFIKVKINDKEYLRQFKVVK